MEENKKITSMEDAYGQVDLHMMEAFTSADGISGCETQATRVMKHYLSKVADEITYDTLGSLIALKKGTGNGPKVMLMGHIDEIGFVVRAIDDKGFIRLAPVGGWWGHVLLSHPVTITTRSGAKFVGVIGSKPPHGLSAEVRSKVLEVKDLFVDLGVNNKAEVELLGIRPGDMVAPKSDFTVMANPNYLMAKAWDNRIGALIATEVLMNLTKAPHVADVYAVGTAQEEVGQRGSKTSTYAIKPDLSIAIDVTIANDIPGTEPGTKMGVGVTLAVMDASHLGHRGLLNTLSDLAAELNLSVQYDTMLAGGTDSGENHKSFEGIVNCTVSIPSRYIHSHRALIHRKDYVDTITLLSEFVKRVDWTMIENLRSANR